MVKAIDLPFDVNYQDSSRQINTGINKFMVMAVSMFVFLLIVNCSNKGTFIVKVVDTNLDPVVGACIAGGVDWDEFCEYTNCQGYAVMPGYARGWSATITKENFFPVFIDELGPGIHVIEQTPQTLKLLGAITGDAIQFDTGRILTVTYHGEYRVYSYDDDLLDEIASSQLPDCIRIFKTYGDTLWLSTHDKGFFAYSLQNPMQPQLICHLDIPGYTIRPFAVKDTFLAVGAWGDSLRLYSFGYDGHYQQLSVIDTIEIMNDMVFMDCYLVAINSYNEMPIIYDLSDPANPVLIYRNSESMYWDGFFYKNYLVLYRPVWTYYDPDTSATYKLIDLQNPASPQKLGPFACDATVTNVVNDTFAIGSYRGAGTSVLRGHLTSGFNTAAIVGGGLNGSLPPYFILGYKLWELED